MKIEYKATIDKFKLSWSNFDEKNWNIKKNFRENSYFLALLMKKIAKVENLFNEFF